MAYNYPKVVRNVDGTFGPTIVHHYYKPVGYHNRGAAKRVDKSKWRLKLNEQYEVFRLADEGDWMDAESEGLYSIVDKGKEVLGENSERIAFFPKPQNDADPWHGYPKNNPLISDELLETWYQNQVIDGIMYKRLMRHCL